MTVTHRPTPIIEILENLDSQHSVDIAVTLEAYISNLESNQQVLSQVDNTATYDPENPPYWSHTRAEQRAQRRREREMKKILHNYQ